MWELNGIGVQPVTEETDTWAQILASPLSSCKELLDLSKLLCPRLECGCNDSTS